MLREMDGNAFERLLNDYNTKLGVPAAVRALIRAEALMPAGNREMQRHC
jgi:hypothetical protein